jgi:lipoate-protein ligase A
MAMHGEYKVPGGKLVVVDLSVVDGHLAQVQVSGDFFLEPDSALDTIDAALHGLPADANHALLTAAVRVALGPEVKLFGITPEAVAIAVRRALDAPSDATGNAA